MNLTDPHPVPMACEVEHTPERVTVKLFGSFVMTREDWDHAVNAYNNARTRRLGQIARQYGLTIAFLETLFKEGHRTKSEQAAELMNPPKGHP